MRPTSVSQVVEAAFRMVVGLAAAYLLMKFTNSVALAAAGAIVGVTVSSLVSTLYLHSIFQNSYYQLPMTDDRAESFSRISWELVKIALPITIGAAGLQYLSLKESQLYMEQLLPLVETNQYAPELTDLLKEDILASNPLITAQDLPYRVAASIKGVYNFAQTIFNMPCAFIVPIAISVIPAITSQITLGNHAAVRETEESAARITGLISLPCSVGLFVLAKPVMALLGGYTGEKLELAAGLLAALGICIFLYAIIQYTTALLQAHGYAHVPVINMLSCGMVKLGVVYILVGNPNLGILGAPIGAILSYVAIATLNLLLIRKRHNRDAD